MTRKMVVDKFKQEEAERNALVSVDSRHSAASSRYSVAAQEDVPISA